MRDIEKTHALEKYILKGLAASNGVGIGLIYIFHHEDYKLNYSQTGESGVKYQITRLDAAVTKTIKEILSLKEQLKDRLEENEKLILDVYKTILEDEYFINEIKQTIKAQRLHAENAVHISFHNCIKEIDDSNNEYVKQRVYDLNDLKLRLIKNVVGGRELVFEKVCHKHIVAVKELTPTLAAALGKKRVMGILAEEGGTYFSHAAIILRGLGIPLINDVNFSNIQKFEKMQAIVSGQEGILIINPESNEIEQYRNILKKNIKEQKNLFTMRRRSSITSDGHIIKILANVGNIEECILAKDKNADGIGLVRTEILFAANTSLPDEKEQFLVYLKIVKKMRNKPIVFRTMDFGGDKIPEFSHKKIVKTKTELRGIRLSLLYKEDFIIQLRSILQVAKYGDVSITFPMVYNDEEIKEAKTIIRKITLEFEKTTGRTSKKLKVGAFIETREAIKNLDAILKEVSFINIGTNDLFQQTMDSDRLSRNSNDYEYLEPEFLKILKLCINKAEKKRKQIVICGEMAADPLAAVLLIGMGAHELSLSPSKTDEIRETLARISIIEAQKLYEIAIRCSSAIEVKKIVAEYIMKVGSEKNV